MTGIDGLLIAIGSITVGLIGLLLLKQAVPLHWRRLTLSTMTWYAYGIFLLIPSIRIAILEEPPKGYLTLGLVLSAALTIPIGVLTANAAWRFRREELEEFHSSDIQPLFPWELKRLRMLTGVTLLFSVLFFWEAGSIPLLQAFFHAGEYEFLVRLREGITGNLRSPFNYLYFMIRQFGWAFVLSCWLGVGLTTRWTKKSWIVFLLLFAFGLLYCVAALVRSPAVVLFIVMFLFYYLFRRGQVSIFSIFLVCILAFSIPVMVLFFHNPSRSWESIWIGIEQRIFHAPAKLNFQYVEIFPEQIDFLYGRGVGKISTIIGLFYPEYEYFPISQEVYRCLFPDSPYLGNAPAPFVGMAYANWGVGGPLLYGLMIGFILQSVQVWLLRQPKNIFILATQAVLFYSFFEINRTDFFACMLSYGGLLLPIGIVLLRTQWNFFKRKVSWANAVSG